MEKNEYRDRHHGKLDGITKFLFVVAGIATTLWLWQVNVNAIRSLRSAGSAATSRLESLIPGQ